MIVLGIDTASTLCGGVALVAPEGVLGVRELGPGRRHAEELIPAILDLEGAAGRPPDRIGVAVGPGSFTGVRVGIAAARGLSDARGVPAVGVGCLDILARACYDATSPAVGGYIISAVDVRRGEVASARYRVAPEGPRAESEERLVSVADAGAVPAAGTWICGDGARLLWPEESGLPRWEGSGTDRAVAAARLAGTRENEGMHDLEPRYARPADARRRRKPWERS